MTTGVTPSVGSQKKDDSMADNVPAECTRFDGQVHQPNLHRTADPPQPFVNLSRTVPLVHTSLRRFSTHDAQDRRSGENDGAILLRRHP